MPDLEPDALQRTLLKIIGARQDLDGLHHASGIEWRQTVLDMMGAERVQQAERYIPRVAEARFGLVTRNASCHDLTLDLHAPLVFAHSLQQLLGYANTTGNARTTMILRSEATMLFDGAVFMQLREELQPEKHILETCGRFSDGFQERFFVGEGHQRFWSVHVPAESYRTESVAFHRSAPGKKRVVRSWNAYCRLVRVEELKRNVWCILPGRPKYPPAFYFKALLNAEDPNPKRSNDPLTIHDEGGLKFFVVDTDDVRAKETVSALLRQVRAYAIEMGAEITEELSGNLHAPPGTKADPRNDHSAPTYMMEKFMCAIARVHIETQGQILSAFTDQKTATTDANHAFYELSKCATGHFPRFFPTRAFGIVWDQAEHRRLKQLRMDSLAPLSAYETK